VRFLDLTLSSPAEQLAADEALLVDRENGGGGPLLRIWEPAVRFVVLGYANRAGREVNLDSCRLHRIAVYRRTSGGGAVVQGPGCLNFSLILPIDADPRFASAGGANSVIMHRNAEALQPIVRGRIEVSGFSDLSIASRKFSGNAQRRLQSYLLFHGCVLLDFDFALLDSLLPMPSREPDYRRGRPHGDFLCNLHVSPGEVVSALRKAWGADVEERTAPLEEIGRLARERYADPSWTFK
jgi:lipoate-protein ligase A